MPASSMCSMRPPITHCVPSATASTSTSIASSRNWSTRMPACSSTPRRRPHVCCTSARRRSRSPWRARRARARAARAPDSRWSARSPAPRRRSSRCRWRAGGGPDLSSSASKRLAVLREVDRLGAGADDRHLRRLERLREVERRLAAELHDHALRLDALAQVHHVLGGQRLEEQHVGGVVVGRDGLRVGVDHHGLVAEFAQGEGGVDAAVVELDALADAVRAAAEDHDLLLAGARAARSRPPRTSSSSTASPPRTPRRAGVDELVDGLDPAGGGAPRGPRLLGDGRDRRPSCASENPHRASPRAARRRGRGEGPDDPRAARPRSRRGRLKLARGTRGRSR